MIDTVTIVSCDRQPSYLKQTVESIPENFNIEIFYQGDSRDLNLDKCKIIEIDYVSDDVYTNAQYNYYNALLRSKDKFIIEDDVIFSSRFNEFASILFPILENFYNEEDTKTFAIALYSCYDWGTTGDIFYIEYPVERFYGLQSMIYSKNFAENFGEHIKNNLGVEPHDFAIKTWINSSDEKPNLLASPHSLVQHIGEVSTGLGYCHKAGNFVGY